MTTVVRIADYKRKPGKKPGHTHKDICFDRRELDLLLSVYSRRVINGEWKDYAIRHDQNMAAFLVYRNASQHPSFTVVKRRPSNGTTEFCVYHGRERIRRSVTLSDALSVLKRKLKPVN